MNKKIILALSLSLVLTACNTNNEKKEVSNEKSLEVSDLTKKNEDNLKVSKGGASNEISSNEEDNNKANKKDNSKDLSVSELRDILVKEADFDQSVVDSLTDEDIKTYSQRAESLRKRTGYWHKLQLFFNEIAKDHPSENSGYPEPTITEIEQTWNYTSDDATDMYTNARRYIGERGFDASNIKNGELRKLFFDIYENNKLSSYSEQIDMAAQKLKEKYENSNGEANSQNESKDTNNKKSTSQNNGEGMGKFGESKADYDDFRKQLVENYGFDKNKVNDITDADIDLASYRAQGKLEETGFGDIGLIIEEIGKMYPGYSTMYPGK